LSFGITSFVIQSTLTTGPKIRDHLSVAWDGILDRFPEGTVDGLYLPDFGELAAADDRHTEAMDRRLSGLHG